MNVFEGWEMGSGGAKDMCWKCGYTVCISRWWVIAGGFDLSLLVESILE